jgi:hypothetical protein
VSQDIGYLFKGCSLACHLRSQGVTENMGPGPIHLDTSALENLAD